MINWFKKYKIILISFAITSIVVFILTTIQISIITQPDVLMDLNTYMETNEISSSLKKYVFVVILNIVVFAIWAIMFLIIMWRVFFPTNKAMKEALQIDSFQFLYDMPRNLKKELKRDE